MSMVIERHAATLNRDGWCVIERALDPAILHALETDLAEPFAKTPLCQGAFYGERTRRFGSLLTRSPLAQQLVMHPLILKVVEQILLPWCGRIALNLSQTIEIHPGALPQLPHRDQDMWAGPKGSLEYLVNVMWPLTLFTRENGGTLLWTSSQCDQDIPVLHEEDAVVPEVSPGDALLFLGSTLHGGGGNNSAAPRRGIVISYCLGWLKPFELQWLIYPPSVARHFLQLNPALQDESIGVMLNHWAAAKTTRNHAAECERLKSVLAKIHRHRDPSIPSRRPDPRSQREVAKQWRKPHIYTPADVRRMLDIARCYPSPRAPLRPLSIYTMLLLAYCAGLRRGELARLDLGDVDLQGGTITIRETKFFKTRILPLPDSVMTELRAYIEARHRADASPNPRSGLFWHEQGSARYTQEAIAWMLVDVIRRAGLKPPQGRTGPRLHDLRHSMVVNRILEWYRSGINPQDRLPFLAT